MICASFTGVSLRSYANSDKSADLLGLTNRIPFNWPGLLIGTVSLLSQLSRELLKIVNRKKTNKQKTRGCLMETWNREMNGSDSARQIQTKGKSEERIIVLNIERVVSPFWKFALNLSFDVWHSPDGIPVRDPPPWYLPHQIIRNKMGELVKKKKKLNSIFAWFI